MYKERQCFWRKSFIILALLFATFFIVLKSEDVNAQSLNTQSFDLQYKQTYDSNYHYANGIYAGFSHNIVMDPGAHIKQYQINTVPFTAGGNFASLHFETNIVSTSYFGRFNPWVNLPYQTIIVCNSSPSGVTVNARNLSYATTYWVNSQNENNNTLTFYGDVVLKGFTQGNSYSLTCAIGNTQYSFYEYSGGSAVWFEQNPMTILFTNNETDNLLNIQINQTETIINQNETYYNHEYQAEDNISGQTAGDISDASNNVTTNLLGIIQSFITELGTLQATDCNLEMPFPEFMGGTTTVNICQGRDVLGNTVAIISSVALIMFYIPLAFVLIRLIYNEIRSWTNG